MPESVPYAVALIVAAVLCWDAHKRRSAVMTVQLSVNLQFEAMKRDFELLTVQTKKAIEVQHKNLNDALVTMNAKLDVENLKRQNQDLRRIG